MTGSEGLQDATTSPLRFRLADDSFYEWLASADVSQRRLAAAAAAERFWRRWLASNWTGLPNATTDDDYDAALAALEDGGSATAGAVRGAAAAVEVGQEDVDDDASWTTYSVKAVVQLLSTALVAFTVNRYTTPPDSQLMFVRSRCTKIS